MMDRFAELDNGLNFGSYLKLSTSYSKPWSSRTSIAWLYLHIDNIRNLNFFTVIGGNSSHRKVSQTTPTKITSATIKFTKTFQWKKIEA